MEAKNVCITINSLASGGAENQCILLAQALRTYHSVTVVVLNPRVIYQPRLEVLKQFNINYVFLSKNPLKRCYQLIKFFKTQQVEFIFSFLPTDTILSAICGRLAGVRYIFGGIRSSSWPKLKFTALKIVNNYLLNYTIANNYAGRQVAIDFGFNENVFVIPNGIKIRLFHEKEKHQKSITVISLGRLVSAKRYDIAIQTIARLKSMIGTAYKINYKIVGQGPEEEMIRNLIRTFELVDEIEILTNASDIYDLLDNADLYLCTSSFEGISNALMEAMNCAIPIVATNVGDNSHLVLDKSTGFLVEVNDIESLADKLNYLIENPNIRYKMGQVGYQHLIANFSFDTFQKKYLNLISEMSETSRCDSLMH